MVKQLMTTVNLLLEAKGKVLERERERHKRARKHNKAATDFNIDPPDVGDNFRV